MNNVVSKGISLPFLILTLGFLVFFSGGALHAANQVVTSNADSGVGTLRQAIVDVLDGEIITFNLTAGNEVITINSVLGTGFAKGMTIDGDNVAGSGVNVTIQVTTPGTSTYATFNLRPATARTVSLKNMTIKGGNISAGSGGAIQMADAGSSLRMENCTVRDSKARFGAGLYAVGFTDVTIINSTFTTNTSSSHGGAIRFGGAGNVSITGSTFDSNTVTAGSTWNYGGAIYFQNNSLQGILLIDKSTISNNTILAGIGSGQGGGVWTQNVTTTTITNSTLNNNNAGANSHGGGIYNIGGKLVLTNSTIFGNTVSWNGGGVYSINGTGASITNATIANNSAGLANGGGGLYVSNTPLEIKNTLLGNNTANAVANDFSLSGVGVTDNGYNIVEFSNGYTWLGTGDLTGAQALLNLNAGLAANGTVNGTNTVALLVGSVAIDAGDGAANGVVAIPSLDQRGLGSASNKDIGAYEFGAVVGGAPVVAASVVTVIGSGGCTIGAENKFDPTMIVILLLSIIYLGRRRIKLGQD